MANKFAVLSKLGRKGSDGMISFSQFNMYQQCPHRWKLRYVDKQKFDQPSIHLVFGTAMHEVIQKYLSVMFEQTAKEADRIAMEDQLRVEMIIALEEQAKQFKVPIEEWTTPEELTEFLADGTAILEYLRKNRRKYYSKRTEALVGVEVPMYIRVLESHNVYFMGFIDFLTELTKVGKLKITDFKTSTRGWQDRDKKDPKIEQLRLYKALYARDNKIELNDIEIEYLILKRKLNEYNMFPQKRLQQFVPSSGKPTCNKSMKALESFVEAAFETNGKMKKDPLPATQGENGYNCNFCPYKDMHNLCDPSTRK